MVRIDYVVFKRMLPFMRRLLYHFIFIIYLTKRRIGIIVCTVLLLLLHIWRKYDEDQHQSRNDNQSCFCSRRGKKGLPVSPRRLRQDVLLQEDTQGAWASAHGRETLLMVRIEMWCLRFITQLFRNYINKRIIFNIAQFAIPRLLNILRCKNISESMISCALTYASTKNASRVSLK